MHEPQRHDKQCQHRTIRDDFFEWHFAIERERRRRALCSKSNSASHLPSFAASRPGYCRRGIGVHVRIILSRICNQICFWFPKHRSYDKCTVLFDWRAGSQDNHLASRTLNCLFTYAYRPYSFWWVTSRSIWNEGIKTDPTGVVDRKRTNEWSLEESWSKKNFVSKCKDISLFWFTSWDYCLEKDIIQGTLSGKRKRERLGSIIQWTHMDLERLLRVADNRKQWEGRLKSNSI